MTDQARVIGKTAWPFRIGVPTVAKARMRRSMEATDSRKAAVPVPEAEVSLIDVLPLLYLALPTLIYLTGWLKPLYGIPAAIIVAIAVWKLVGTARFKVSRPTVSTLTVIAVAAVWSIMGGVGHFVYANFDWTVRDAVLLDLVRKPWPVVYDYGDHQIALLRAPIGLYLPSAVVGKLLGIRAAELTMLAWIVFGTALTLKLMLRDVKRADHIAIRLAVFMLFSGMDIVGQYSRHYAIGWGVHIEWWASLYQFPAITTQLFWAPGHALPGWIAAAWLIGRGDRRLPIPLAVGLVVLMPMWSPLAALGCAPLIAIAIVRECWRKPIAWSARALFNRRVVALALVTGLFVLPYLVLGSETIRANWTFNIPWVGEDFAWRYGEFVIIEFALIAFLLVLHFRFDPLLFGAIAILLAIPFYQFGPANDLALRASNAGLAVLAMRLGQWLSTKPGGKIDVRARFAVLLIFAVGAVTPVLEVSRLFTNDRWDMNLSDGLIEAAKGRPAPHYLTPRDHPWPDRFMR